MLYSVAHVVLDTVLLDRGKKKGKKSVMNKFRYVLIEYLCLSFQRCYLFREVMQAMSNTVENNFHFSAKGNECV